MIKPVVLIRPSLAEKGEIEAAIKVFGKDNVFTSMASFIDQRSYLSYTQIKNNVPVVARYCLWPFYKENEQVVTLFGDKLLNTHYQHQYIADLADWYGDLKNYTPKTWFQLSDVPKNGGPFVLKGETNSKKFQWNTHAFAKDFKSATDVYHRLSQDSMIGEQNIYIREYVELEKLSDGLNGLPITKEFRFFVLNKKIISGGYYWASHIDDLSSIPDSSEVPRDFLQNIIDCVDDSCNFYVIDVAKTTLGDWILIELNDAQQSGLSCIDPEEFYFNIYNNLLK